MFDGTHDEGTSPNPGNESFNPGKRMGERHLGGVELIASGNGVEAIPLTRGQGKGRGGEIAGE